MSDEEREAVKKIAKVLYMFPESKELKLLLNLIENQQKEIEELQAINQMQKYRIEVMDERELISRDKVEEIIKTEIEECKNEKENANRIYYNYWNRFEQHLQSILNKIKGDDK